MKFCELKDGDVFTINREKGQIAYMKEECKIVQLSNGKYFKLLNGNTIVTKIGEALWLTYQFGYLSSY